MDKYLKIGEFAELGHVSTQALRLYANSHLLEPEYLDPETGYRYYRMEQCAVLDLINALKSCQMKLGEIRELFENIKQLLNGFCPEVAERMVPTCEQHAGYPFCTEREGCGKHPKLADVYVKGDVDISG